MLLVIMLLVLFGSVLSCGKKAGTTQASAPMPAVSAPKDTAVPVPASGESQGGQQKPKMTVAGAAGKVVINPKDGAEMVRVPAGDFVMGSTKSDVLAIAKINPDFETDYEFEYSAEMPQHKVRLGSYWIYKQEVTVKQYRKFCQDTGRAMPEEPKWGQKDDYPVGAVFF